MSSAAGTGGVAGVSYTPLTVTSAGVPSFGTRVTVDTTSSAGTTAIGVDVGSRVYLFYATGAIGSAGVIDYRTLDSPYSAVSAQNTTVAATAGDGYPYIPRKGQAFSGFVPFVFQRGTASFTAQYDNTISAQTLSSPLIIPQFSGLTPSPWAIFRYAHLPKLPSPPVGGGNVYTQPLTGTLTFVGSLLKQTQKSLTASLTVVGAALKQTGRGLSGALSFLGSLIIGPGLTVSTQLQSGISGGPPGNNTTETDVSWLASGTGWRVARGRPHWGQRHQRVLV